MGMRLARPEQSGLLKNFQRYAVNSALEKSKLERPFKNYRCKEHTKFKVDAYLDWFEFEVFEATQQLENFQRFANPSKKRLALIPRERTL